MQNEPAYAREALSAGALGYVLKEGADAELVEAVRRASAGDTFLNPRLGPRVAAETLGEATAVQFPGLTGVLPGLGRMEPNDWGLAVELRDAKSPHWTGARNSARTFGHFGASGTFLWVDPDGQLACGVLTARPFGDWAKAAWPALSDAVLADYSSSASAAVGGA